MDFQFIELLITSGVAICFGILKFIYNKFSSEFSSINNDLNLISLKITNLQKELNTIKIESSKTYLEKEDFRYTFDKLSKKFEKIFDKLEKKKDKS